MVKVGYTFTYESDHPILLPQVVGPKSAKFLGSCSLRVGHAEVRPVDLCHLRLNFNGSSRRDLLHNCRGPIGIGVREAADLAGLKP